MNNFKQIPILRASILFDENDHASVEFEKLHSALVTTEYVKIVFHYYAKMKLLIGSSQLPNALVIQDFLFKMVDDIAHANLKEGPDILKIANLDDVVKLSQPTSIIHSYVATFYGISGLQRHITTEIPDKGYLEHLAYSVPVLIVGALPQLTSQLIDNLQQGLRWMNGYYADGFDFTKFNTWETVPNSAFMSGMTSEKK